MTIYETLDRFVGAGLIACSPAVGCRPVRGDCVAGGRLSGFLRGRGEADNAGAVLDAVAQDVWLAQDSRGLPHAVSQAHATQLIEVLDLFPPRPQDVAAAIEKARSGYGGHANGAAPAHARIAADVLERARAAGALGALEATASTAGSTPQFNETVALFLLDRLLCHLLDDPGLLAGLAAAIGAFLGTLEAATDAIATVAVEAVDRPSPAPPTPRVAMSATFPPVLPAAEAPHAAAVGAELRSPLSELSSLSRRPLARPERQEPPVATPRPRGEEPRRTLRPPPGLEVAPELLRPFMQSGQLEMLADLVSRQGFTPAALERALGWLERRDVAPDQRLEQLDELANWVAALRESLTHPSNEDIEARRLRARALTALGEFDLDFANDLMRQMRRRVRDNRRRIEERLEEEVANLRVQMGEEALATARLAELAMARHDFEAAHELFAEAMECAPHADRAAQWRFTMRQAEALQRSAARADDARASTRALAAYESAVQLAGDMRDGNGEALALAGRASVLVGLARRVGSDGIGRLGEAVTDFKRAIATLDRAEDPRRWANVQLQLGNALADLAERKGEPRWQHEAGTAFRAALGELDLRTMPLEWSQAHAGLANAMLSLAAGGATDVDLTACVDAFRSALQVLTQGRAPQRWWKLQQGLGDALLGLGESQGLSSQLEEAVAAYREAASGIDREHHPRQWAIVQISLGKALMALGDRDPAATSRYEEAITAFEAALAAQPREQAPLQWGRAQMRLGLVLIRLGERRDKRRHWLSAASAMMSALETFEALAAEEEAVAAREHLRAFHGRWASLLEPSGSAPAAAGAASGRPGHTAGLLRAE